MKPNFNYGLVTVGDDLAWAVTSPDDRYRYLLGRTWDESLPSWTFVMLNPSKARGAVLVFGKRNVINDPTIRKCIGFAQRGGAGGIIVANALAYSDKDPNAVRARARGWHRRMR